MQLNTTENIEDSTLTELMRSLGVDGDELTDLMSQASAAPLEQVVIEDAPGKEAGDETAKPIEKRVAKPRRHYANKVDRLRDTLADGFDDAMLLSKADLKLQGKARADKQFETAKRIKGVGVKVQNRVTFLIEYAQGKTAKLNNVMQTALDVLKADGKLTTGNDGNLVKALVAGGKTPATARTMAGNTVAAFKVLDMVEGREPHTFYPNPDSVLLERLSK